jgi:hypothetical protein
MSLIILQARVFPPGYLNGEILQVVCFFSVIFSENLLIKSIKHFFFFDLQFVIPISLHLIKSSFFDNLVKSISII